MVQFFKRILKLDDESSEVIFPDRECIKVDPVYQEIPIEDKSGDIIGMQQVLICPVCGKLIKRSDNFCSQCGALLNSYGRQPKWAYMKHSE